MNPVKTFGRAQAGPVERIPFDFYVMREDEPEKHSFLARRVENFGAVVLTAINARKDGGAALAAMIAFIAKILDNKDGVPHGWEPTEIERPKAPAGAAPVWPGDTAFSGGLESAVVAAPEVDYVPSFRAPTVPSGHPLEEYAGTLVPLEDAPKFLAHKLGSSRRRWSELMAEDSEVTLKQGDLTELFEWLVGVAAERPTRPSS